MSVPITKLKCPAPNCAVACGSLRAASQHALLKHAFQVQLDAGDESRLIVKPATYKQLEKAETWNRSKARDRQKEKKGVDESEGKTEVEEKIEKGKGVGRKKAKVVETVKKPEPVVEKRQSREPEKMKMSREPKEVSPPEETVTEAGKRVARLKEEVVMKGPKVRKVEKEVSPAATPAEVFSSAGETVSAVQTAREKAAQARRVEAEKGAAAYIPFSVDGRREETEETVHYEATPIVPGGSQEMVPYEFHEGMYLDMPTGPEGLLAYAARVAGVVAYVAEEPARVSSTTSVLLDSDADFDYDDVESDSEGEELRIVEDPKEVAKAEKVDRGKERKGRTPERKPERVTEVKEVMERSVERTPARIVVRAEVHAAPVTETASSRKDMETQMEESFVRPVKVVSLETYRKERGKSLVKERSAVVESAADREEMAEEREEAAVAHGPYREFGEGDEEMLIGLASQQAPAWRKERNVRKWMEKFPGCDPAVVARRYHFLLRGWSAFRNMNDTVLGRDGRQTPAQALSASVTQGLNRYHTHGKFE